MKRRIQIARLQLAYVLMAAWRAQAMFLDAVLNRDIAKYPRPFLSELGDTAEQIRKLKEANRG